MRSGRPATELDYAVIHTEAPQIAKDRAYVTPLVLSLVHLTSDKLSDALS